MEPTEVITETNAGGYFACPHGNAGRPSAVIPDLRDDQVALEVTGFDDTHVRGVLRSRDTGEPVAEAAFTARFLVVT